MTMQDTFTAADNYISTMYHIIEAVRKTADILGYIVKEQTTLNCLLEQANIICKATRNSAHIYYRSEEGTHTIEGMKQEKIKCKKIPREVKELRMGEKGIVSVEELYKIGIHLEAFTESAIKDLLEDIYTKMKEGMESIKEITVSDLI